MARGDSEFEKHVLSRAEGPPERLFKYCDEDTYRAILANGTLRFQSPRNFNDPFDSQWDPHWCIHSSEGRAVETELLTAALRGEMDLPQGTSTENRILLEGLRAEYQRESEAGKRYMEDRFVKENLFDPDMHGSGPLDDFVNRLRLLCLSERSDSILMWSHYASNHTGFLLAFDAKAIEQFYQRPLYRMNYGKYLPQLIRPHDYFMNTLFGVDLPFAIQDFLEFYALMKHDDWSYEKEWRMPLISPKGESGLYNDFAMPKNAFVGLVRGCRASQAAWDELKVQAGGINEGVQFHEATQDRYGFSLNIEPVI